MRHVVAHLKQIAVQFREGDFSAPRAIPDQDPPGVDVLKRLAAQVTYDVAGQANKPVKTDTWQSASLLLPPVR